MTEGCAEVVYSTLRMVLVLNMYKPRANDQSL